MMMVLHFFMMDLVNFFLFKKWIKICFLGQSNLTFPPGSLLFGNSQNSSFQQSNQQNFIQYQQQKHQQQNYVNNYDAINKAALLTQWQQNQ